MKVSRGVRRSKRCSICRCWLAAVPTEAIAVLVIIAGSTSANEIEVQRFSTQGPAAWREYATAMASSFDAKYKTDVHYDKHGVETRHVWYDSIVKLAGERQLAQVSYNETRDGKLRHEGNGRVAAKNDLYGFSLRRNSDAPWQATNVVRGVDRVIESNVDDDAVALIKLGVFCGDCDMSEMVDRGDLHVLGADLQDGNNLVRVRFNIEKEKDTPCVVKDGWFSVDPSIHWLIREYEVTTSGAYKRLRGVNEYDVHNTGLPVLKRRSMKYAADDPSTSCDWTTTLVEFSFTPPPKNEFLLTAYGLPEPPATHGNRRMTYVIVLNVLVLIALILLILRRWRTKLAA